MHIDSVEGFFLVQAKASGPEENPVLLSGAQLLIGDGP